jgi:hypothetical protein
MRTSTLLRTFALVFSAAPILLAGCATDQVALDQANNAVKLVQNLQVELKNYQNDVKLSAQRRLNSTHQADIGALEIARDQQWSSYLYKESGLDSELAARQRLRDASDNYSRIIAAQDKAQEELAARLTTIAKELPSPADKLGAVQKAMAQLGVELSAKERVAIVTKFLKQAKCIVDESTKTAASDAPKGAASTPAPAASAPAGAASSPKPAGCTSAAKPPTTPEKT